MTSEIIDPKSVPIFVLCGGMGTRLKEHTEFCPKPMVPIGSDPILLHIMHTYATHGFRHFVLCTGYKSEYIKDYFLKFYAHRHDATIELASNSVTFHEQPERLDWRVTVAFTGEKAMTGARVRRAAERYLGAASHFGVTYGDGLTDADLGREWDFHCTRPQIGTVLGVNPPSRFGEFQIDGDQAIAFHEKPAIQDMWINGGYFFFRREFLKYVIADDACVLERVPLRRLAEDGQLNVFRHRGFWECMDTQRDHDALCQLWASGDAPWRVPLRARQQKAGA